MARNSTKVELDRELASWEQHGKDVLDYRAG